MLSAVLLIAALILAPIIGGGFGELTNSILQILIFGAAVAFVVMSRREGRGWPRVPALMPLAVFLVIVLVSGLTTEAVYSSLTQILILFACLIGYTLAAALARDNRIAAAAVWGVAISALIICVLGIRDYAISTGGGAAFWRSLMSAGDHQRLFGTFVNPGFFAGFLVVALPVTIGLYLVTRRSAFVLLAGVGFVVQALALMLTGTKFGIVSAVFGLLVFFVLAVVTKSLRRARFTRLIILACVMLPLLIVFSGPVRSRIDAAESGGTQVHSTSFRIYTWQATVNMIKQNLWLGVGPGAYDIAYPRYTIAGPTKYAHQSYLQIASESGVFALAAFVAGLLALAWRTLASIIKGRSETDEQAQKHKEVDSSPNITWRDMVPYSGWRLVNCAVFGALSGSVVRNLVDSDWYVVGIALPFWVLAGVLAAQSGAVKGSFGVKPGARAGVVAVCAVFIIAGVSFGLGSLLAPDMMGAPPSVDEAMESYRFASRVSPLNPLYHKELAKYIAAEGDYAGAKRELARAVTLSPTDGSIYFTAGILDSKYGDVNGAEANFKKSLECNPNSTQSLYELAQVYAQKGDVRQYEATLTRLVEVEQSLYEQVKGVPELVDTNFAYAHVYFGKKALSAKDYPQAVAEFTVSIERLERWRSNEQMLKVSRFSGLLSPDEEVELLELLRDSYLGLADTHEKLGEDSKARDGRRKADKVQEKIDSL